jgi:hypothetical protein
MRTASLVCVLTLVAACGDGPTGDIFAVEGIVEGQLTSPEGTPVSGAWVVLDGRYPLANGTNTPLYDSTQSDAEGHYRGRLAILNMPDTLVHFSIRVWPPAASGLAPDETIDLGLQLTREPAQTSFFMNIQLAR